MHALVTGGAGFIGSHLVDALVARGDEVTVVDDYSTGRIANLVSASLAGVVIHRVDIRDAERLGHAVAVARPDAILHLAAQMDVRRSVADPAFDARTNVEGTINVLEAARACGARVVNISTGGAIYGDVDTIPTPEHVTPLPEAPYGQSKFCAERYVDLYGRLFGVRGVTVRLGNVYGPRQDPLGDAGVVAIFCGCLERGERPTIYGTGTQTRDYVYVGDVVDGLLAALDRPDARGEYNIGTGAASSVLDIAAALAPHAHAGFEPRFADARTGEIERSCLDVTRAREELGFSARVDLAEGLRRTVAWAHANTAAAGIAA
jgi:UDP-glucose 4-epimerase